MERRLLKRDSNTNTKITGFGDYGLMLLNSATSFHLLHLQVKGTGSYAAHEALQEYYEAMPDLMDCFIEQYQGNTGVLLSYSDNIPVDMLSSTDDAVNMLKAIYSETEKVYVKINQSEILAKLDDVKNLVNKTKYKLMFLN